MIVLDALKELYPDSKSREIHGIYEEIDGAKSRVGEFALIDGDRVEITQAINDRQAVINNEYLAEKDRLKITEQIVSLKNEKTNDAMIAFMNGDNSLRDSLNVEIADLETQLAQL